VLGELRREASFEQVVARPLSPPSYGGRDPLESSCSCSWSSVLGHVHDTDFEYHHQSTTQLITQTWKLKRTWGRC
jgi:hypothetical protein